MTYRRKLLTTADIEAMTDTRKHRRIKGGTLVCDFCGTRHPVWVYAAKRMTTGEEIECWRWAACTECAAYVTAKDWTRLKDRVVSLMKNSPLMFSVPEYVIRTAVDKAFQSFFSDAIED